MAATGTHLRGRKEGDAGNPLSSIVEFQASLVLKKAGSGTDFSDSWVQQESLWIFRYLIATNEYIVYTSSWPLYCSRYKTKFNDHLPSPS